MESALSSVSTTTTTSSLFTITKALNRRGSRSGGAVVYRAALTQHGIVARLVARRLRCICDSYCLQSSASFGSASFHPPSSLRSLCAGRASGFAASFSSGGGNGSGGENGGGGGGGGGSGSDGGDAKSKMAAKAGEEVSAIPTDVIVLDVGV